jgi:hypothetical protein
VGPNWKGDVPSNIAGVVRSSTDFAAVMPRIFMNDTPEDREAIQPVLNRIMLYPLSQFDGKMKTKDWRKLPVVTRKASPKEYSTTQPPWVDPETFFDELPIVMKQVPPMPGEQALYKLFGSVLGEAAKDPEVAKTLQETAFVADKEGAGAGPGRVGRTRAHQRRPTARATVGHRDARRDGLRGKGAQSWITLWPPKRIA